MVRSVPAKHGAGLTSTLKCYNVRRCISSRVRLLQSNTSCSASKARKLPQLFG